MPRLPAVLIALPLAAAVVAGADDPWSRVATPHFVVSGDAPTGDLGRLAARLESLRSVFVETLPRVDDRSLLPTFVVVFRNARSFEPYQPAGVTVGGFALHEPFMPCLVLRSDRSAQADDGFRSIVHEYVHVLADAPWMPLWLVEGMADYYSATTISRNGQRAALGDGIPAHLAQAAESWLSIATVIGTPRTSPLANDTFGLSFYAESWLLVHYLIRATPEKGAQIGRFIDLLYRGTPETPAFEQAIGSQQKLEIDLQRYLRGGIRYGEERAVTWNPGSAAPKPRPMTVAEVDATLGRLLFQLGRAAEAEERLSASTRADGSLAEPLVTLGALRMRQGNRLDALAHFRRVAVLDPSNLLAAYQLGRMALETASSSREPSFEDAYAVLSRAAVGRDGLPPEALATLGTLAGRVGRLDDAERLLRHASERDARQLAAALELANVCLRVGKFPEARATLDKLVSGSDRSIVQNARRCAEWLPLAEARAAMRAELAGIAGLPDAGPDLAISKTGSFPMPPRVRTPGAGEERRLGLLEAMDCVGAQYVVRVSTRSGLLSLATSSLSSVHLASARDDVTGALPCGARAGREAVYVTWKGDAQLVALEFLPADLQPGR